MTGEELCLEERELSNTYLGAEHWVGHLLALSRDVRLHEGLTAVGGQLDGAAVAVAEVGAAELLTVDQGEHEAIRDQRAELLDQVEREARPTRTVGMEEAYVRVQACGGQGGGTVVCHQGVNEREQRVDSVEWWTAGPSIHREVVAPGGTDESGEDPEVDPSGIALVAADAIDVGGIWQRFEMLTDQ